jgi:hypothetical protein
MEIVEPLPYVGESPFKGVYRIAIILEREFSSKEYAEECAQKSTLGEEECRFIDCDSSTVNVEFVRSTVTPETHPYICRYCRDESDNHYDSANPPVSHTTEGRCEYCDQQDWTKR